MVRPGKLKKRYEEATGWGNMKSRPATSQGVTKKESEVEKRKKRKTKNLVIFFFFELYIFFLSLNFQKLNIKI